MSEPSESNNIPSILGGIASIVGLLGIALYFTGWIYRLAYYGFFQLEVTTLDFPLESFLLVPIQVLFGNIKAIITTIIAIILGIILISVTLWLLEILGNFIKNKWQQRTNSREQLRNRSSSQITKIYRSFVNFISSKFNSLKLRVSLLNDLVIVFWVLIILFWLAFWQGLYPTFRTSKK